MAIAPVHIFEHPTLDLVLHLLVECSSLFLWKGFSIDYEMWLWGFVHAAT